MLVKAQTILPVVSPPIPDGMVCIEAGQIVACGPERELRAQFAQHEVIDLGQSILLPGLINSHCHLDYMMMKGSIIPVGSFSGWIQQINGIKRMLSKDDYLLALYAGFDELLDHGTTTVVNIESFPEIFLHLRNPPLRILWALEFIDLRVRQDHEDFVDGLMMAFEYPQDWLGGVALSPHAPYTASVELYRLTQELSRQRGYLLTSHIAESDEEYDMFVLGKGRFADFMRGIGRDMRDCGFQTPFQHLLKNGAIDDDDLLVHMNYLSEQDIRDVGDRGMSVCFCPKSHHYFNHARFPLDELRAAGARICLGTDSLASNNSLDLFSEMRAAKEKYPQISDQDLIEMCTVQAARSIHQDKKLGQIAQGACADLIALPDPGGYGDVYSRVCAFRGKVPFVMVNGKVVRDESLSKN